MAAISVFTVTNIVGSGATATYTGSITFGTSPLITGTPIVVQGLTHTLFNGTYIITGGNLTTTFTAANANAQSSTADSGTATYNPESSQSYPTADTTNSPVGFGYLKFPIPYKLTDYGNFTPGTLPGTVPSIDF